MSGHHCESWQMLESTKDGSWYCGSCGAFEVPTMTAAGKAMQEIGEALEAYFEGRASEPNTLNTVARINGAYSVERIGERA